MNEIKERNDNFKKKSATMNEKLDLAFNKQKKLIKIRIKLR